MKLIKAATLLALTAVAPYAAPAFAQDKDLKVGAIYMDAQGFYAGVRKGIQTGASEAGRKLDVVETNPEALKHLKRKLKDVLSDIGWPAVLLERSLYLGKDIPLSGTAHQAGTCRFGTDPTNSVLNLDCRAHEIDNLYITDASFFPSIGAVNPTLTIIANALRVADIIKDRL